MKKICAILLITTILTLTLMTGFVAASNATGPAPNSGDGISDGSGFNQPNQQQPNPPGNGPAPNSGDGISDGSGF